MINVFHIVSNKIWSGPEQYAYDLALRLRNDNNYYIEVVCKKSEAVFNKFRSLEIPVSILPLKGLTDLDSPVRFAPHTSVNNWSPTKSVVSFVVCICSMARR